MRDHVVICGLGRIGRRVLDLLRSAGVLAVAIDLKLDPGDVSDACVQFISGDFRRREVLESAMLAEARAALVLTSDDLVNLSALMTVLQARPELRVVVRMFNPSLISRLGAVTSNVFALSDSALAAPMLALIAHSGGALAGFTVNAQQPMVLTEWTARRGKAGVGKPLIDWQQQYGVHVVARQQADGRWQFFADLDLAVPLKMGDRLIVCGTTNKMNALTDHGEGEPHRQSSGELWRRLGRMLRRVWSEIDFPMKLGAAIFSAVIIVSAIVFRFGMKNDTLVDAFYRAISLVATGADMHGNETDPGSWQRGFISVLRLMGVALTAAFTAVLTNYLVRAHLGGALEVRRIPEKGHIILVGLGNVGFRVVEQLTRLGERVVAIERQRDNRFVTTARRLGAAVIVGDGTVTEVLRQAHAAKAKSLLATTRSDLTNLEIGLLAREVDPKKRVVVRLSDSRLAQLLRDEADIRLAMSIPDLAAPAFVAGLWGDRVRAILLVEGQLLAVVDLAAHSDHLLAGRTIADLAQTYRILPIALTVDGQIRLDNLPSATLEPDSSLTALVSFRDLELLFQRESGAYLRPSAANIARYPLPVVGDGLEDQSNVRFDAN